MKRLILAAGGLLLATANTPPSTSSDELDSVVAAEAPKASEPAAKPAMPAKPKPPRIAVAAETPAGAYPRCSTTVHDRCSQGRSQHARSAHSSRMQLAMRAGERG